MKTPLSKAQQRFSEMLKSAVPPADPGLRAYHYAYLARIAESLAEDFPGVAARLGDGRFHSIVREYLGRHPSRYPSLSQVGRDLPSFLAHMKPALGELARSEWDARMSRPFEDLPALPEHERLEQVLVLAPGARPTGLEGSKRELFEAIEGGAPLSEITELAQARSPEAADWIREWAARGMIVGFTRQPGSGRRSWPGKGPRRPP